MNKKSIVIMTILMLILASFVVTTAKKPDHPKDKGKGTYDIYVDCDWSHPKKTSDGSKQRPYTTIQDAIDNADEGDSIFVYSGTYYENVIVDKTIDLIGEDKFSTIITCPGSFNEIGMTILSDNVTVSDFKFQNIWSYGHTGIRVYSNNTKIYSCIFVGNGDDGITILGNNTFLEENVFENNADGIGLGDHCINNLVISNYIFNCSDDGIYGGSHNFILNNTIENCSDDGIYIFQQENNSIQNNLISYSGDTGIETKYLLNSSINGNIVINNNDDGISINQYSNHNIISFNHIENNTDDGIQLYSNCMYNHIKENSIISNKERGIQIEISSDNNWIYHNNIIDNTVNAFDECLNYWNNNTINEGNYWSDYNGIDADGDGIGDTLYDITGGSNQDLYPLMFPYGHNGPIAIWHFDEGTGSITYDSSIIGNDGIIHSASWCDGISGTALSYDGIDDWVEAGPVLLQNHTINAWVKVENADVNAHVVIENPRGVNERTDYGVYITYKDSKLFPKYLLRRASDDTAVWIYSEIDCMDFDTWHMITTTYDRQNASIYVDGDLILKEEHSFVVQNLGQFLGIGDDAPIPIDNAPFDGVIDELSIYNYALSLDEILSLYHDYTTI